MLSQDMSNNQVFSPELLKDAMSRPIVKRPHWVQDILAPGVTILAGAPKAMKSFLALEMSLCITSDIPFAEMYAVNPTSILYLHLDSDKEEIPERIQDTLNYHEWNQDRILLQYECPPSDAGLGMIYSYLKTHPGVGLLVIDTIGWVQPITNVGNNLYLRDYRFMSMFKTIYSQLGVSSLLLHHTRKQESLSFLDEVSGSRGMTGGAHNVLVLSRSGNLLTLKGSGSKLRQDIEICFKFENRFLMTTEKQTIKQQILGLLISGPKHYLEIAKILSKTEKHISVVLSQMVIEGLIRQLGKGLYGLES